MAAPSARADDAYGPRPSGSAAYAGRFGADGAGGTDHARRGPGRPVATARIFIFAAAAPPLWSSFRCTDLIGARTRIRPGAGTGLGRARVSQEADRRPLVARFDAARA